MVYFLASGALLGQTKAKISIDFNYDQVGKFLEIFEKGEMTEADFDQLMSLHASQAYAKKLSTFFDNVDDNSYRTSLDAALAKNPLKNDPYMLYRVVPELETIRSFLEEIKQAEDQISTKAASMIASFTPDSVDFQATVYLVVGITGGGWTFDDEPNAFYVDIRSLKGDMNGLIYLSAHELYHLVQDRFFTQNSSGLNVERLLSQTIREGSASYMADFSKAESKGDYTEFNQNIYKVNSRRIQSNFDWFDTVLFRLANDGSVEWESMYQLGLTGQYDSPLYFVGYEMMSVLDANLGREQFLELLGSAPMEVFRAYIDLVENSNNRDLPAFSGVTRGILDSYSD